MKKFSIKDTIINKLRHFKGWKFLFIAAAVLVFLFIIFPILPGKIFIFNKCFGEECLYVATPSCVGKNLKVDFSWPVAPESDYFLCIVSSPGPCEQYIYTGYYNYHTLYNLSQNKTYLWSVYAVKYNHLSPTQRFTTPSCTGSSSPPTVDLTSWPTFELPEQVHLYWTSTNANSCVASGDWSGSKPTSGDEYLSKPRGTYTFILTCTGRGGRASDSVTVKVIQVPKCTFTANPTSIIPPQSSTLSWECIYADSCSIDQGVGSVNNPVSGTKQVRPTKTTTYTLTCDGLDGSRSYQATVVGLTPRLREVVPR